MDTGIAASGMIEARQFCRNRITTRTTSNMASTSVWITALIESRTNTWGSQTAWYVTPGGNEAESSSNFWYTALATSSESAPGVRKMPTCEPSLPSTAERKV